MLIRSAYSLDMALAQLNTLAPNRSKLSDGGKASAAHTSVNPTSDHEPDETGVYHARDFTHDPENGADMSLYPRRLIADPRAKYVIFNDLFYDKDANGRIRVRPYILVNPARTNKHDKHLHLSTEYGELGDDGRQWEAFTLQYPNTPEDEYVLTVITPGVNTPIPVPVAPAGKTVWVSFAIDEPGAGCNVRVAVGWDNTKYEALLGLDKVDGFTGWIFNGAANAWALKSTAKTLSVKSLGKCPLGVLLQIR